MRSTKYSRLSQKEEENHLEQRSIESPSAQYSTKRLHFLRLLLTCSILLNIGQLMLPYLIPTACEAREPNSEYEHNEPSFIMGLIRNVSKPFASPSGFHGLDSQNQSEFDDVWKAADFDPNRFTVALDTTWAAEKGLPATQPWPWDEGKGIYSVRGMHLLHCTKSIHITLNELHNNKPQTWSRAHIEHCVHLLREETMCNANDNLVYTGRVHGQEDVDIPIPGLNQYRVCRDWSQLHEWVKERSACCWNVPSTGSGFRESDRYKYCPDGRNYWD